MSTLTGKQVDEAHLEGWVLLQRALHTRLLTGDFATGLRLVAAIGAAAEAADHHPDLDLRYTHLDVALVSHDAGGVTARDVALARAISELAAAEHVPARPTAAGQVELALDSPDADVVRPFWREVLGAEEASDSAGIPELRGRTGSTPTVWFQPSGDEADRQRFHLDVWVDPAVVQDRIDGALAAGGELVDDEGAPSYWVLADAEGNRVCLCTWQDRD